MGWDFCGVTEGLVMVYQIKKRKKKESLVMWVPGPKEKEKEKEKFVNCVRFNSSMYGLEQYIVVFDV